MSLLAPFDHSHQIKFTESPDPTWSYCKPVDSTPEGRAWLQGEEQGWKTIDTSNYDPLQLYKLMISGIMPRPIAFIASVSEDGKENLAPFSWFNIVTYSPPLVSFCCAKSPREKDTAINVRNGKGFTVNIISEPFLENANITAINAPAGFEEWSISGLTKVPSVLVKAPRVKESAFSMECELYQVIDLVHPTTGEPGSGTLFLAHVKYIHVRNDVLTEQETVDLIKFKPVARLGDVSYGRIGDAYRMPRAVWEQEQDKVKEAIQQRL